MPPRLALRRLARVDAAVGCGEGDAELRVLRVLLRVVILVGGGGRFA